MVAAQNVEPARRRGVDNRRGAASNRCAARARQHHRARAARSPQALRGWHADAGLDLCLRIVSRDHGTDDHAKRPRYLLNVN
ncbi:MAG: hypothetical protein JWM19_4842 [Actinomycetia bacterium]|nr:hypothetical protein [Actinomycetes bacterium]